MEYTISMPVRLYGLLVSALLSWATVCPPVSASVFGIDQWSLGAGCHGNFPFGSGWSFQTVTNPFNDSINVTERASTAYGGFDFSWNDKGGDFLTQGSQRAVAQNPPPYPGATGYEQCGAGAALYISSNTDLLFTLDAAYSYDLAGPSLLTEFTASIADSNPPYDGFLNEFREADTYTGFPLSGAFTMHNQLVLPAGRGYTLDLEQLMSAEGNTGATGTGDGYLHFTLQSIPAPAAFFPLALGALALRRRRR